MKKTFLLILTVLLCLSLCACSSSKADEPVIPTDSTPVEPHVSPVTVSVVSIADAENADDLWFYQQIEEKFGCEIEVVEISYEDLSDTMVAMLAEGDLPTIFESFLPIDQTVAYGEEGKFIDVMAPENLAKMPNFAKIFVEDDDVHRNYMITAAEDGSHYILPAYDCERDVNHYWIYNETAFTEAGVEWAGDPEGFLDMLRALKKHFPDSYPMTGGTWQGTCDRMIFSWGVNSSYAAYNYETNQWFYGAASDAYYDMLSMFQTAYNEKLLLPEVLHPRCSSFQDDMITRKSFLYNSWLDWMVMHNQAFTEGYELGYMTYNHEVPAPTPVGPNGMTLELKKFSNTSGTVISARDPEAAEYAMAIMDWMYDTSENGGAWLATVGPAEALDTLENGRYTWNYEDPYNQPLKTDINPVREQYGMFQTSLTVRYCDESPYFTFADEVQQAQDIGAQIGYVKAPPMFVISDEELAESYKNAQDEIQDMQTKFILENWDRDQFDDWAKAFNETYKPVIDYLNSQA